MDKGNTSMTRKMTSAGIHDPQNETPDVDCAILNPFFVIETFEVEISGGSRLESHTINVTDDAIVS